MLRPRPTSYRALSGWLLAVRALAAIGRAAAPACRARRRALARAVPPRALALLLALLACDFVRRDTENLPEMCFPA